MRLPLPALLAGLLLAFSATASVPDSEAAFRAAPTSVSENRVPLRVSPAHGLQFLDATLDGVPCTLLLDTGASHTTFDLGFLRRKLSGIPLRDVQLAGSTNVTSAPKCFTVGSLTLGSADLKGFVAMALPLGHLSQAVGEPIDGILGMNTLCYAPFRLSLRDASVTWYPDLPKLPGAMTVPVLRGTGDNAFHLIATHNGKGKTFPVLLDSGASVTFMDESLWPAAGEPLTITAAGINRNDSRNLRPGRPGDLVLGTFRLPVRPLITRGQVPILGADALRGIDLFVDGRTRTLRISQ